MNKNKPPLSLLFFWETSVSSRSETFPETCRSLYLSLDPFHVFRLALFLSFHFQSLEMPGCQNQHQYNYKHNIHIVHKTDFRILCTYRLVTSLLALLLVLLGLFIASLWFQAENVSKCQYCCHSSTQWWTDHQSHSPDSPLEERSEGDLDCDLFFFLWYSSSSDSEPCQQFKH